MLQALQNTINVGGTLMDLSTPKVMGILNVTPDSFYEGCRAMADEEMERRVRQMVEEGADILDVGACSTRPGAEEVSASEEWKRLKHALEILRRVAPEAIVSIDTFRAEIARRCVEEYGVHLINDISGGELDPDMFGTIAKLGVPYILTHSKGTPKTMQQQVQYTHLMTEILQYFGSKTQQLHEMGVKDVILDPGFGFAKTMEQNYHLMGHLKDLQVLGLPLLVGISRKSMIFRLLETSPQEALNGTTMLNTLALCRGANILRVHDVKECVEVVRMYNMMKKCWDLA